MKTWLRSVVSAQKGRGGIEVGGGCGRQAGLFGVGHEGGKVVGGWLVGSLEASDQKCGILKGNSYVCLILQCPSAEMIVSMGGDGERAGS